MNPETSVVLSYLIFQFKFWRRGGMWLGESRGGRTSIQEWSRVFSRIRHRRAGCTTNQESKNCQEKWVIYLFLKSFLWWFIYEYLNIFLRLFWFHSKFFIELPGKTSKKKKEVEKKEESSSSSSSSEEEEEKEKVEEEEEEGEDDAKCIKCNHEDHPETILLCDNCNSGAHLSCLRPPLFTVPEGDWLCPPCEHVSSFNHLFLIFYIKNLIFITLKKIFNESLYNWAPQIFNFSFFSVD